MTDQVFNQAQKSLLKSCSKIPQNTSNSFKNGTKIQPFWTKGCFHLFQQSPKVPVIYFKGKWLNLLPYPCSHFYFDINFGDRLYSKENRPGSPLPFWIKSVAKFDIKVKVTTWIGHMIVHKFNFWICFHNDDPKPPPYPFLWIVLVFSYITYHSYYLYRI